MKSDFSKKIFLLLLVASIIFLFFKNNIPNEITTMYMTFSLEVFKQNSID
ncbi:hypothetical protein SA3_03319 [Enterococcus faecalis EnGen0112]|nr:hypothetical protein S9Y_03359 [Enterococcus faecalis EnGen0097]EOE95862.1 hypothetical protein SA3_03319 [Enterococcus faecalis EnGen0112]